MSQFAFGQPSNTVVQMAYLVEDVQKAMADWSSYYNVGPFFLNQGYVGDNSVFRGQPNSTAIDVAMGFAGHMQIELIQVATNGPSIYHEAIDKSGYGFHHVGIVADDFDEDVERMLKQKFSIVMAGNIRGTRLQYAYLEKADSFPGYVELIPKEMISQMFVPMYRASIGWSGKDPIRHMKA